MMITIIVIIMTIINKSAVFVNRRQVRATQVEFMDTQSCHTWTENRKTTCVLLLGITTAADFMCQMEEHVVVKTGCSVQRTVVSASFSVTLGVLLSSQLSLLAV